jgi:hypothetical protein
MIFIKKYKYILNVFIVVLIIFIILLFSNSNQKITIESLKNKHKKHKKKDTTSTTDTTSTSTTTTTSVKPLPDTTINMDPFIDFCKSNLGSLKEACSKLTNNNCNKPACCVVLNGEKCVAGSQNGPTFKTESGKDINIDYYYFQNKCYGDGCPAKKNTK